MNRNDLAKWYDFTGQVIVLTGGAGILGGAMARALASCGASMVILDRAPEPAKVLLKQIEQAGGKAIFIQSDVLDIGNLEKCRDQVMKEFGRVDALINGAGGNNPKATTSAQVPFFSLPTDALRFVFDLNILGTMLPSQVFGKVMADQKEGNIVNISSLNAFRPLTRIPAYSAAKAGVSNFTQWLAVHVAQEYSPKIRVNAIAPGFFLTDQNRFLLTNAQTGELTDRGKQIMAHTPMKRFGDPEDLLDRKSVV